MSYKLFLDDVRPPPDETWVVARSVDAAWTYLVEYGLPQQMSLDHDLGDGVDAPVFLHRIIDAFLDEHFGAEVFDIKVSVHSANPVGVKNLQGLWQNFCEVHNG